MTFTEFDKFQDELFKECVKMRDTKGKEYANSADRFANFNRIAQEVGVDPLLVAWVYTKKHLDSIAHYVKTKEEGVESIRGRFVDAIVYLSLMAGISNEQITEREKLEVEVYKEYKGCATCRKCGTGYEFDSSKDGLCPSCTRIANLKGLI